MSSRSQTLLLWLVALLLGVICGKLVHTFSSGDRASVSDEQETRLAPIGSVASASASSSAGFLWRETAALKDTETFSDEVDRIHRESRSPLRASSLLSFRIHNSNFEDWENLISAGKVKRIEFLRELGEHLARTDPRRALRFFFQGPYSFDNLDQVYAFRDPMIRTAADADPEVVLEELMAMKRGGSQMDNSLFFSGYWAKSDPHAAAEHFSELVRLRNMRMDGSPEMPDGAFANIVMKSWLKKAPEEAEEYVGALSSGPTRQALAKALQELSTPK